MFERLSKWWNDRNVPPLPTGQQMQADDAHAQAIMDRALPRPTDGGPCPLCGEDMGEQEYPTHSSFVDLAMVRGRYWHMKYEHGILEHYDW